MKSYLVKKTRQISLLCAGLVGFSFGVGATVIGVLAFILAIFLDAASKILASKIEQNESSN